MSERASLIREIRLWLIVIRMRRDSDAAERMYAEYAQNGTMPGKPIKPS